MLAKKNSSLKILIIEDLIFFLKLKNLKVGSKIRTKGRADGLITRPKKLNFWHFEDLSFNLFRAFLALY